MEQKKSRFHDYSHALEYDQRAGKSDIRAQLEPKLIEALECKGGEWLLDLATGTGRFARPVAERFKNSRVVGLDEALAMLRVAREQKGNEPIPGFLAAGGAAEAYPFRDRVFDRAFTVFALHHFSQPLLMMRETLRVLRSGGRFVILDPVVATPEDSLDETVGELINRILERGHGEHFHYYSSEDIVSLFGAAVFRVIRSDRHTFFVDQDGIDGIPTGRHWVEVAEHMQKESPEIRRRFEERYFHYEKRGEKARVRGSFAYSLVCGEKR